MSQLDDLISRSRSPGAFVERKRFTLSRAKAIEKQREYALRHPTQYILELIQAAVLSGATYIAIDITQETLLIAFIGGRPFKSEQLENVFDFLFADRADARHRHMVQLAIGLNALLQRSPKSIRIESGDGKKAVRLDMDAKGKGQIGQPMDPIRGTYLLMEKPGSWFSRFQNVTLFPEQALIEEKCVHCPVPIILNGVAPFGYTSKKEVRLFGEKQQQSFDVEGGRRGVLAIPKKPGGNKGFKIVMGGVWVTSLELPELGTVEMRTGTGKRADAQLFGVICDDNLRKTADQSDIVQDARFTAMLAAVQPTASAFIEETTGQKSSPPELPSVELDGPTVLPLPKRIKVLGPEEALPVDEVRVEASTDPIFWLEPGDRASLEGLADPSRFPFRVLELQEGEARALLQEIPHISMQRIGTAADVDFVRRVMERNLRVHEVEVRIEEPAGTLKLRFHGRGPRPPWGEQDRVPGLIATRGRTIWCGALHTDLPHVSAVLESEGSVDATDALRHRIGNLVVDHAWRLLEPLPAGVEPKRVQALAATLLGQHARPQFAEEGGETRLAVALPPEWGEGATALRRLSLADAGPGPLSLDALVGLQGTDKVWSIPAADFQALAPLQGLFGWGHLRPVGDDPPLVAVGLVGERWVVLSEQWGKANPRQVLWLSGHLDPVLQDPRWTQVEGPAAMIGAAVRAGNPPADWAAAERTLLDRLERDDDWSGARYPDQARAMARLAAWRLAERLSRAPVPLAPSDGSAPQEIQALRDLGVRASARGGIEVAEATTVLLSLDELRWLESEGPIALRFDDDPSVWRSLTSSEEGWLIRHEVRLPGLHGWLGLRSPFDATTAILVRRGGRILAVPEVDARIPCHGLLYLERGHVTLTKAQAELLALEGLQLYQKLAEGLRRGAFGGALDTARRYGTLFAWLAWKAGRAQLATVEELARSIPVEVDGDTWGTLEAWLRSPAEGRPSLPIQLPALAKRAGTSTALVPEGDLQKRTRALLGQLGRRVDVHFQAAHERFGAPVRVDMRYSRYELLVLVLNHNHPVVTHAATPGRTQEILLLEIARQIARWSAELEAPLDLLAMQQILLAQRLTAR